MKHYLFLFSLLALAAISGCKKDKKCNPPKMYQVEQEMMDWLYFKTGSYWIYIDSVSGAYDSVYVTKTYYDTLHQEGFTQATRKCTIQSHQEIVIEYESSGGLNYNVAGSYGFGSGVSNNINPVNGTSSINNLKQPSGDGGFSKYMFFPVLQGTVGRWAFGWTFIRHDTIYSEYEVLGKTYQNVLRVHDNYNMSLGYNTKFYHVKNIGVIRKEYYEIDRNNPNPRLLHVWELADYKVSQ